MQLPAIHPSTFSARAFVLALTTSALCAQTTWRVPGDKATIAEAVTAAADGDRILLVDSVNRYAIPSTGITLAKSLIVETVGTARATVAYPEGQAASAAAFTVTGLGTRNRLVMRNLDVVGGYSAFTSSPVRPAVVNVQLGSAPRGELVLDAIKAVGEIRHVDGSCPGLRLVTNTDVRVVIRQCRFEGASGRSPLFASGEIEYQGSLGAIVAAQGPLLIEDTNFVGGDGGRASWANFGPFWTARDGGKAVDLNAPRGAIVNSVLIEGSGGPVIVESSASGNPDPCTRWGQPADSTGTFQIDTFHCVRRVIPYGCNQTAKDWPLNIGRHDLEIGSPRVVGTTFRIKAGSLQAGQGVSALLFGIGTNTTVIPGIEGKLYLDNWLSLGVVPPSLPYSWTDVWFPAPPPGLPALLTCSMQLVHLDAAFTRTWFGSPATFTVLAN